MADENGKTLANKNGGRPSVMTMDTLNKLREAFAIGCTKVEACAYAKIGESTLYDYINANPLFSEEIEILIQTPILKAKNTIVKNLDDVDTAKWYLQRKKKDEFSNTLIELNQDNRSIEIIKNDPRTIDNLTKAYKQMMKNLGKLQELELPEDEQLE